MASVRKRFECLEAGCDFLAEAASDEELVAAVQAHVVAAHRSFELEEFILAGAVEVTVVPAERTRPPWPR